MQSLYLHHTNPQVFPEPFKFNPERWIEDPKLKPRYLMAWGRGSRSCLGLKYVSPSLVRSHVPKLPQLYSRNAPC